MPLKVDPRIRLSGPAVTAVSCCTSTGPWICPLRVFTAGRSAAELYSMTLLVYAKLGASPWPVTVNPWLLRSVDVVEFDRLEERAGLRLLPGEFRRRVADIGHRRHRDELDRPGTQALHAVRDRHHGGQVQAGVGGQRLGDVADHVEDPGGIREQVALLELLQHRREEVLLALDPLVVRALADVLPEPDEGERLRPGHVVLAGREVQSGLGVVDRDGQADRDPADVVDYRLEPGEVDFD